ncbi:hypothetical protein ACHHYP_11481 [Achlya hypogyna]|uniref:DUF659 domain-containing protein n=1 Tax=Achlya hypogyna TaxID=1202772 RepID=A0A1V9YJ38_ACHHY|nr:hypothetical protein ACHHYP_11481 [Achlya hypogyna]
MPRSSPAIPAAYCDKMTNEERKILDALLADAIHHGAQPFTVVSSDRWRKFLERLRPSYVVPDADTIGGELLDDAYLNVQKQTLAAVAKMPVFCITINGATLTTSKPILNIMICGPKAFFIEHFTMGTERETAVNLHAKLVSFKARVNNYFTTAQLATSSGHEFLPAAKTCLWTLCTDSPKVMIALRRTAVANATVTFAFGCAPHALNNCCLDWMKLRAVKATIASAVAIVTGICRLHRRLALVLFTKTRWSTCRTMLERLLRVRDVLQLLPLVLRRPGATVRACIEAVDKLLAPVCAALTFLGGEEATHSSVYACFLAVAVAVKELPDNLTASLGNHNRDVLVAAVKDRFHSIYSPSHALAFVTDPLFIDMGQHLVIQYGTDFVQLSQASLNSQCNTALGMIDSSPQAKIKAEFSLWLARPCGPNSGFWCSRAIKPHLLWAQMAKSAVAHFAPALVQVHANSTGAVGGERTHLTTKRVASAVRSRIGEGNVERQVAIAFNGSQLARELEVAHGGKFIGHLVDLGSAEDTTLAAICSSTSEDASENIEDDFPLVEDPSSFIDEFLVEEDWGSGVVG